MERVCRVEIRLNGIVRAVVAIARRGNGFVWVRRKMAQEGSAS